MRDLAGDLVAVSDDSIQTGPLYTYEVDKLGRTTKTYAKYIPGGDRRLDYAYDARGDLVTFTLNEPNEVLAHVYSYAADSGRIATALFPGESSPLVISRWPHDGVKSIDYPGGVRREVDYDVRGPVSEIRIKPPAGTPLVEKWTYTYTDVLNVATMRFAPALPGGCGASAHHQHGCGAQQKNGRGLGDGESDALGHECTHLGSRIVDIARLHARLVRSRQQAASRQSELEHPGVGSAWHDRRDTD